MVKVYINYPNGHIRTHRAAGCGHIQQHATQGQRYVRIGFLNLPAELQGFVDRKHRFGSQAGLNDMWIDIDLGDDALEDAILRYIHRALSACYAPFQRVTIERHC